MANMRQAFPALAKQRLDEQACLHFQWHAFALLEYPVFFFRSRAHLQRKTVVTGIEALQEQYAAGRPVIVLLLHSVMLEFAAVALSNHCKTFGSYKHSKNKVLDWLIARSRRRYVDAVVAREDGLRPLIRLLKSQRVMLFLPDEDLGIKNAVFTEFYGRKKATLTTPARLCKLANAQAFVAFTTFNRPHKSYQLALQPLPAAYSQSTPESATLIMNQAFEAAINSAPEQYMWTLKLFKTVAPDDEALY